MWGEDYFKFQSINNKFLTSQNEKEFLWIFLIALTDRPTGENDQFGDIVTFITKCLSLKVAECFRAISWKSLLDFNRFDTLTLISALLWRRELVSAASLLYKNSFANKTSSLS